MKSFSIWKSFLQSEKDHHTLWRVARQLRCVPRETENKKEQGHRIFHIPVDR